MNLLMLTKFFDWARKDFKLFSVIMLGCVIVFFYHKEEGNNTETKDGLKDCKLELKSKDMKMDTLKEIINVLKTQAMIDSIKNNKK